MVFGLSPFFNIWAIPVKNIYTYIYIIQYYTVTIQYIYKFAKFRRQKGHPRSNHNLKCNIR